MRRFLPLSLALLSLPLAAQPQPGDWIVSDSSPALGAIFYMTPGGGPVPSLYTGRPTGFFNGVMMARDNTDLAALFAGGPRHVVHVTPTGLVTTVGPIGTTPSGNGPNAIDQDQDGNYLVTTDVGNGLYRVDPVNSVSTSLMSIPGPGTVNAAAIDQENGDLLYGTSFGGLFRMHRTTQAITSITGFSGSVAAIDFEPRTGQYIVVSQGSPSVTRRVSRTGVGTMLTTTPYFANAVKVDDETGNLLIAGGNAIAHVTPAGGVITSLGGLPFNATGVETHGSRKVTGFGPATAGSSYTVLFAFPRSANQVYYAAMSTGLRPGVALPDGRTINLDITSPLFPISIGGLPGITLGFSGFLNSGGQATGTIAIPPSFPAGIRIFVSALALNPFLPLGLDTANTIGFTTN